jgi:CDP-paratose 2-epimerase
LPSVVFRQSCIYGPRQFGIEDQGWVAWFVIAAVTGRPLAVYGDGKQVRDLLHVDDLLDAYDAAIERQDQVKGQVFNLGGGPDNTLSIWDEFGPLLERLLGEPIPVTRGDWRPGDQKVFVADIRRAGDTLGWKPKYGVEAGIRDLFDWVSTHKDLF